MHARNIVQLAYGIPGILCYFLIFYAMFGLRQDLNGSFMLVYATMSITNIATWINVWLSLKLANEPFFYFYYEWLKDHAIIIDIHAFLISHFYYAQNVDVLLLTFDRFYAIYGALNEKGWWRKYYIRIIILVHGSILGAQLLIKLPIETDLEFDREKGEYQIYSRLSDPLRVTISGSFQIGFGVALIVAVIGLSIYSIVLLNRLKAVKNDPRIKSPFLLISSCIVTTQLTNLSITTALGVGQIMQWNTPKDIRIIFEFMFVTSDMFSILPALYTILIPGPIQKFLLRQIIPCWNQY